MKFENLKKLSAEDLNVLRAKLQKEYDTILANYQAAANREAKDQIEQMKLIDYEFRIRSWADHR